jgi:Raf kinase inhibitor-like YbhB/YbcL family protein
VVTDGTDAAADSSAAEDDSVHGDDGTGFVVSAPWAEAGQIPVEYGCQGEDISPPLSWSGVPEGTVELAVVMTDLDADNFVHWVAFGIDPGLVELPAGQLPEGVAQATNSFGNLGYGGPCPPTGSHTYLLEVYAVSQQLEIADGTPAADALTAIQSASLAVATVLGLYPGGE